MKKKYILFAILFAALFMVSAGVATDAMAQDDVDDDPWVFQDWCLNHVGCGKWGLRNKTDGWLQVMITDDETGETGFFSVPPKGRNFITLRPGKYHGVFYFWCGGKQHSFDYWGWRFPANQFWEQMFKCTGGTRFGIWWWRK